MEARVSFGLLILSILWLPWSCDPSLNPETMTSTFCPEYNISFKKSLGKLMRIVCVVIVLGLSATSWTVALGIYHMGFSQGKNSG